MIRFKLELFVMKVWRFGTNISCIYKKLVSVNLVKEKFPSLKCNCVYGKMY